MSLTLPQLSLGAFVAEGDLIARIRLVGTADGDLTIEVTAPSDTRVFNDRQFDEVANSHNYLTAQLTAAEADALEAGPGATWGRSQGMRAAACNLKRSQSPLNGSVSWIELPHPRLTPDWFGLERVTEDAADDLYVRVVPTSSSDSLDFFSGYHPAGIWLPPDPPAEGPGLVPIGEVGVSPSVYDNSPSLVLDYGERDEGLLVFDLLYGAWVHKHHAAEASFQAGTADYATGEDWELLSLDHMGALDIFARTHRTCGPLRYFADRDDLDAFIDLEVDDEGWLSDVRGFIERQNDRPALYRVNIPVKTWESP